MGSAESVGIVKMGRIHSTPFDYDDLFLVLGSCSHFEDERHFHGHAIFRNLAFCHDDGLIFHPCPVMSCSESDARATPLVTAYSKLVLLKEIISIILATDMLTP